MASKKQDMKTYRVETTVSSDGTVTVKGVPFHPGDQVEVVVRRRDGGRHRKQRYPLRGKPIRYDEPFESVAEEDWDALK
jgi:hypothetical protein